MSQNILLTLIFIYLSLQDSANTKLFPLKILIGLLSFILLIATYLLYTFRLFVTRIISFLLYLKHGKNFGGLIKSTDYVFDLYDDKTVLDYVFLIKIDDSLDDFYADLRRAVKKVHQSIDEFRSTVEKFHGYPYFLKNQINFDDIISTEDSKLPITSRDYLLDFLCNYRVTSRDVRLWEVKLFRQPMEIDGKILHALLVRINHVVADGYTAIALLKKYMVDVEELKFSKPIKFAETKHNLRVKNIYMYDNVFKSRDDPWSASIQTTDRIKLAIFLDKDVKYVELIRKIKDKLNVSFTEILLAAQFVSVSKYIEKKHYLPEEIRMTISVRQGSGERAMEKYSSIDGTFKFTTVGNATNGLTLKNRVRKDASIQDVVRDIHEEYVQYRNSLDPLTHFHVINTFVSNIPEQKIANFVKDLKQSMFYTLSNSVALGKSAICGREVVNIFGYSPCYLHKNIMLCVITYNGSLQAVMVTKEDVVIDRQELQAILDDTFVLIDQLAEELNIAL